MAKTVSAAQFRKMNIKALSKSQKEFDKAIEAVIKKLNTIPKQYRRDVRKKILKESAVTFVEIARQKAPVNKTGRPRSVKLKRDGRVTYFPGNLRMSVGILPFRKSPSVFVGPKFKKRRKAGDKYGLSSRKTDAFYAGFIEFGTSQIPAQPFMRPAYDQGKQKVMHDISYKVEAELQKWIKKNKV